MSQEPSSQEPSELSQEPEPKVEASKLIDDAASESEGEPGAGDDSSEEEEDDEEEARKVREGFIVDDEEEDEEAGLKHRKHKRKRHIVENEELDEDDLELLRENAGETGPAKERVKFKRLKRGGDEDDEDAHGKGLAEMFSDEEEEASAAPEEEEGEDNDDLMEASRQRRVAGMPGEFDDFIEEDELSEEDEDRDERVARMRSARAKNQFSAQSNIDSDKMDELFEVFGDGEEYAWALEAENASEAEEEQEEQNEQLKDVFEYEELKEHLLTENDQTIRVTDVPERYQIIRSEIQGYDLPDDEFLLKQQWIADQLYTEQAPGPDKEALKEPFRDAVFHVVKFIARDNLEVPTIWNCRKDYTLHTYKEEDQLRVQKLLNENDLWRIVQLDIVYHALIAKRKSVESQFKSLNKTDPVYDEAIKSANSIPQLQDLHDYVSFTYSSELNLGRRQHRYRRYERVRSDNVYKVVEAIGITAAQFGENISSNAKIYIASDPEKSPEELVDALEDSYFKTKESALGAVRHEFAAELAHNPKLRQHLRLAYENYATVDVELTEKGRVEITDRSPYADFKYAINRAIESFAFQPDLFLRMLEAEALGFIVIKIGLKGAYESFVDHLFTFLSSDGTSQISEAWNTLRRQSLDQALTELLPQVSSGIKEKLGRDSERLLFFEVRDRFLDRVDQAPYHPLQNAKGTVPRVLSLSNGDAKRDAAVLAVAMDYDGSIVENLKFSENYRDSAFEKKLVDLMRKFKPEVVAVSGYTPENQYLLRRVRDIVGMNKLTVEADQYEGEGEEEDEDTTVPLPVIYVTNETARVYEHSASASKEFGDKPKVMKFCVGIARYVQNPLLEYISLGDAITSVSVHRYQNLLPEEKFREAIDSIYVDMSSLCGVKINDAVRSEYLGQLVQFIAGFGPRKAAGLLKGIEDNGGAIIRRDDLVVKELTTKNVFMNCAPFLEIPVPDHQDKEVELLDATRIHPEDYELARKMASDALDLTDEDRQEVEKEDGGVIAKLYEEGSEKLDDLLLEGYAEQLEQHGHRKRATLEMIKEELQNNYEELRKSFKVLNEEEQFWDLTSETPDTFSPGMLVPVVIQRVDNRFLAVVTQSDIKGDISRADILPYNDSSSLFSKFTVGQPVQAAVNSVDFANFRAQLSLLAEDVANARRGLKVDKLKGLWDFDSEAIDEKRERKEEEETSQKVSKRFIKHPYFQNLDAKQAEDYLASRDNGDFVIRPSSRGPDHLTITWKLDNQLFQHIDVKELNKQNDYTLGRSLQVGNFRYHDLDELIVSHINRLHQKVEAMKSYEKFRNEPQTDAQDWLVRYSKANKNRSCYCFCFNRRAPGWFYLLFKLNDASDKTYTWNVKVEPTGYQLHGNVYPDMVHLCNGFKRLLQNQLSGSTQYGSYGY